jgi:hypothetical protein
MQQKHLLCPLHFVLLLDFAVMVSELKNGCAVNDSVTTVWASVLSQVYKVWGIAATQLPVIKHCCS